MKRFAQQFALLAFAGPALAEEKAGMPQMDPTWFQNQLFWLTVCFVVVYLVVSRFVVPRVGGVLLARETAINEAIAKAEELKRTADNAKGGFEAAGLEARTKAAAIIAAAQAEAAKNAAEAQAKLATELEAKLQAANSSIAKAKAKAAGELETSAAALAATIIEKLLGTSSKAATKMRA